LILYRIHPFGCCRFVTWDDDLLADSRSFLRDLDLSAYQGDVTIDRSRSGTHRVRSRQDHHHHPRSRNGGVTDNQYRDFSVSACSDLVKLFHDLRYSMLSQGRTATAQQINRIRQPYVGQMLSRGEHVGVGDWRKIVHIRYITLQAHERQRAS
jgi:hypothetical protein